MWSVETTSAPYAHYYIYKCIHGLTLVKLKIDLIPPDFPSVPTQNFKTKTSKLQNFKTSRQFQLMSKLAAVVPN